MIENLLKDKHVLLGVTGSIAAYKSLELVRLLIKAGAKVRVIMSDDAMRFIGPLSFEALTNTPVISSKSESWSNDNNHIHIHKWADIFCIAPATANTINKLSCGIADTLLTQTALASPNEIIIAPAANTHMIEHPSTQKSLELLKSRGVFIVESINKLLACQDRGKGAMAEPETIFWNIARKLLQESSFADKNCIVTGGGTKEPIDDVRCISNHSSGKMAESLALALYLKGANVTLVSSAPCHLPHLPFKRVDFQSSKELYETLLSLEPKNDLLYMAAAVSDYLVQEPYNGKYKKAHIGPTWSIKLIQNRDILQEMAALGLKCIGFKAETDPKTAHQNALHMLKTKKLHAVCLNIIGEGCNFGSQKTKIDLLIKDKWHSLDTQDKLSAALKIVDLTID